MCCPYRHIRPYVVAIPLDPIEGTETVYENEIGILSPFVAIPLDPIEGTETTGRKNEMDRWMSSNTPRPDRGY